jgi:hypothetical protein
MDNNQHVNELIRQLGYYGKRQRQRVAFILVRPYYLASATALIAVYASVLISPRVGSRFCTLGGYFHFEAPSQPSATFNWNLSISLSGQTWDVYAAMRTLNDVSVEAPSRPSALCCVIISLPSALSARDVYASKTSLYDASISHVIEIHYLLITVLHTLEYRFPCNFIPKSRFPYDCMNKGKRLD